MGKACERSRSAGGIAAFRLNQDDGVLACYGSRGQASARPAPWSKATLYIWIAAKFKRPCAALFRLIFSLADSRRSVILPDFPTCLFLSGQSGRSAHWVKVKNREAPAVTRDAEDDWS